MENIEKLVILDYIGEITYVIPYDKNVYEDALECIVAYSKEHDLKLHINNISFMEVNTFKLEVL